MILSPKLYLVFIILSFVLNLVFAGSTAAKIYKCHDESGKVMYKNKPCPEDQRSETVINTDRSGIEYDKNYYYESEDYQKEIKVRANKVSSVKKISSGERVNLNKYVTRDKVTTFLFYADWCYSCEKIRPGIEQMALNSDNIILRKIDITEFESPVTEQYGIKSIPYFFIYDESGDLVVKGSSSRALNYLNSKI